MIDETRLTRIDGLFAPWTEPGQPGGALALLDADERVVHRQWGLADIEHGVPIGSSTRFHIASITKTFVGAAIVVLASQGKLALDDDVRRHVPELPEHGTITLRHLLTMTSGLRDSMETMRLRGFWFRNPRAHRDLLDLVFAQRSLSFPTGTRYAYTNVNFGLLSVVIERASGQPFDSFLRTQIFQPLGMQATALRDDPSVVAPDLATGYMPIEGGFMRGLWSMSIAGAGGLVSTTSDLVRWLQALRAGELAGTAVSEIYARRGHLSDGTRVNYGLGIGIRRYRDVDIVHHGGSLAGYKAQLALLPASGLAFVLLSNRDDADPYRRMREIVDILIHDEPPAPMRTAGAIPSNLPGRYVDRRNGEVATLKEDDGTLTFAKLGLEVPLWHRDGERFRGDYNYFPVTVEPRPEGSLAVDFGGQKGELERLDDPWQPDVSALQKYAGRYANAEIDSGIELWVQDGALQLRFGARFHSAAVVPLEPVIPDVFSTVFRRDGWTFHYSVRAERRDDAIASILVSSDRLKDTRFDRL